jgi:hypothetical protein
LSAINSTQLISSHLISSPSLLNRFREKTVNDWDNRHNFKARPGKYTLIEMDHGDDDDGDNNDTNTNSQVSQINKGGTYCRWINLDSDLFLLSFRNQTSPQNQRKFVPQLYQRKLKVLSNSFSTTTCSKRVFLIDLLSFLFILKQTNKHTHDT